MTTEIKIKALHLIPIIDKKLIRLLCSLTHAEWNLPTVAKLWTVKDVAAHLLDGNLRALSTSRDGYFAVKPIDNRSFHDLVTFLNQLNLSWTNATKRLSPRVLITLLELSGKEYLDHLVTLDPFANALFSVAWAGHENSPNWFHIAREYTEKFLHQQQIRDAVGKPGIMTKELYYPFMDTFMHALPHAFQHVSAENGTVVSIKISTEIGGQWNIINSDSGWKLKKGNNLDFDSQVIIDPTTAWKLFSKSWTPDAVMDKIEIKGDNNLAIQALKMVSVIA
ncbi:MAG: maleylpyruvate isomerase N-terminal domain-containing protein [Saprospiraceae bacterium]